MKKPRHPHPHSTLRSRLEGFLSEDPYPPQDDFDRGYEKGINRAIDELESTSPYRPWQVLGGACFSAAGFSLAFSHLMIATIFIFVGGLLLVGERSSNLPKMRR